MEIAKWTFTSAQLQAIVSKAIQQSAQASSIRLLRLEVLENELPEEMRRLEVQRTELKTRYKMLTRRRTTVVDALSAHMSEWDGENPTSALRLLDNLKEVAASLDQVAEELHSVDGQLAHLDSMTHIHTGSALAMALRKLNASFLKQVAENQTLMKRIETLEAERDEGWRQAECEANEFDRMSERDRADGPSSKRSSRVSAKRKSSSRASRAGLRTSSQRFSQASSLASSGIHSYGMTPSRSPLLRLEEIPPVPPIPKRRPLDILTHSPPLRSSEAPSTTGPTPTSESRALAKAQDDLYAMLGLINPERPLRRSSSASALGSPSQSGSDRLARPPNLMPSDDGYSSFRRSSLPPDSQLAEVYNAMEADRNAVLATIDMLSSDTR